MANWTEEEKLYLVSNYKKIKTSILAERLNRNVGTVRAQAASLGVATSEESFDLPIGSTFDRWSVIKESESRSKDGSTKYVCECVCGTVREIRRASLVSGKSKSCGCRTGERVREVHSLPDGEASFNSLYVRCKNGAKRKNKLLEFLLTPEEHKNIVIQDCHYCGAAPRKFSLYEAKVRSNSKHGRSEAITNVAIDRSWIYANTVDRIDSDLGYTVNNCVPACWTCNRAKLDSDYDKFLSMSYRIVAHQEAKKKFDKAGLE